MITNLKNALFTLFLIVLSVNGFSQACPGNNVTVTLQNFTENVAHTQLEFDVFVANTGSTTLQVNALVGAVIHNVGALPTGATGTFTAVTQPSATGNFPNLNVTGPAYTAASRQMRWSNSPAPNGNGTTLAPGAPAVRFARFRFTSSLAFSQNFAATLTPQYAVQSGYTNFIVTVYCEGNGSSTGLSGATAAAGTLNLPSPYNVVLNVPSETCFTSGSQTATTPPTCAGDSNGSATVTMSPAPTSNAITYSVDGGASTPGTLVAGAFTITGLTSGAHTLSVTGAGTCTTPVVVTNVSVGAGTPLSTPTVGLTSSDLDNTFVTGTSVTFTASAANLAGGTANYDFKVNGGSVQSGASNTFATSSLVDGDDVSVEITVTGGTCLSSSTASSTAIENTVISYFSSVTSYCGQTMTKLASTIYCSIPSGVVGTLSYRFKVRKTGTLDTELVVNRTVNSFNLSLVPSIAAYGTQYDVRVAAVVNGTEQPFSSVCVVTTPAAIPAVSINQCGATLAALNSVLSVNALSGATSFRYIVAVSTAPTVFYTLTSSSSSFRLTDVPSLPVNYGSTYSVSAQQLVTSAGESTWSPAGTCNVMTPSATLINVQINQCGQTLATMKSKLTVNGVLGATAYTFRVSTQSNFSAPVQEITNPYSSLSLSQITAFAVTTGTQYYVQVRVTANGVDSAFGTPCSFFTPELAKARDIVEPFMATAYPNPFADNFMIDVATSAKENINIKVYDMVGRLVDQRTTTANDLETSTIGGNYPSGVYNVIVTQGSEMKTLRVIKR